MKTGLLMTGKVAGRGRVWSDWLLGKDWLRNRGGQRFGSGGAGKGAEWGLNPCSPKRTPADDL